MSLKANGSGYNSVAMSLVDSYLLFTESSKTQGRNSSWPYIRVLNQETMKFLKALLVVILILISGLLLIGVFVPEVDDDFEITVNRPVVQVFAAMVNLNSATDWVIGLDSIQHTSGFLAMPGSEFTLYYSGAETNVVYTMEVLKVVPMESVQFRLYNEMFEFVVSVKFEADGMSTKMDTYVQIKGQDLITRSFLPLLKSSIMEVGKDNFKAFKQLQEQ